MKWSLEETNSEPKVTCPKGTQSNPFIEFGRALTIYSRSSTATAGHPGTPTISSSQKLVGRSRWPSQEHLSEGQSRVQNGIFSTTAQASNFLLTKFYLILLPNAGSARGRLRGLGLVTCQNRKRKHKRSQTNYKSSPGPSSGSRVLFRSCSKV